MADRAREPAQPSQGSDESLHHRLKLRCLEASDYDAIRAIMDAVYDRAGGAWTRRQFASMLARFPEGQFCIEDNGTVVAAALSLIVDYKRYGDYHTHEEITGNGYFTTHDPSGDSLYGVDVFVHPDYRGLRLGRRLYDARKQLCRNLNLRRIIFGGRIPNYDKYSDELTPQAYIERVKSREIYDPVLTFQLSNDFHVRRVITKYLPEDEESHAYAVISQWINIHHQSEAPALIGEPKRVVRVAAVQWQMRPASTLDDLRIQLRYFVSVVSDYGADFVLLPEYFNAALMAHFHTRNSADAVRQLAEYTESIRAYLESLAVQYNINIVAGSLPELRGRKLRNICYLLRRDGTWDYQYKLHVTPAENDHWAVTGGDELKIFDTDEGRIGILVCYDVQFPELARLLSSQGLQILFVPYLTDTKSGYLRVKRCCQARAIENECYVVATGSTGSLPNLAYMDIHYSQSAIFTPADFIFPHDAIKAEATPNTETTLIADLDLDLLKELGRHGSVRNLEQRRLDLYRLQWVGAEGEGGGAGDSPE
ncbi:MAG: GNAT family N-acetyltransferase [Gammaproteobacteria bacterium]|nr:GNAT family N-acetyltransferase [Gammaproteobacteria bacterium]NIM72699.1 GNAT family N-acetyltransferase [Gammaproteobacteria bacterium]NIN37757.1 GNAT family N-acetyltransferase [Gammaproteobacteria bacterium]NIO24460.1 GNAT family N-acetyltransferase [Gammaproteobacteria bacterium]NIO65063.1 GNAT family N-acetyltransferase [Gammaproteobacteria bacterium]